jgi:hypothetical protein
VLATKKDTGRYALSPHQHPPLVIKKVIDQDTKFRCGVSIPMVHLRTMTPLEKRDERGVERSSLDNYGIVCIRIYVVAGIKLVCIITVYCFFDVEEGSFIKKKD